MKLPINVKTVFVLICIFILIITLCACKDKTAKPASNESGGNSHISSSDTTTVVSSEDTSSNDSPSSSSNPSSSRSPSSSSSISTSSTAEKTSAQLIIGKWRGSINMAPIFAEMGYEVDGAQIVSCDIEFTSGDILYEIIDRTSLKEVYTKFITKVFDDTLTEQGLTKEQFETTSGMTYDEYLSELIKISMDSVPKTIICAYKFAGDDLYIRSQSDADFIKTEYSFNGQNSLTLSEGGTPITYARIQ
ncbi:MAG: hypothetical protein E7568_07320 [Ruminococcaceae bacterium]|nr:hypothetical protein [Oscillospiraceae bacterium]